jgi:hypothetical protein
MKKRADHCYGFCVTMKAVPTACVEMDMNLKHNERQVDLG